VKLGFASSGVQLADIVAALDTLAGYYDVTNANADVAAFQLNVATGTMTNPDKINDNVLGGVVEGCDVGKYVIVDLGAVENIKRFRIYGQATNLATSTWKISTRVAASGKWIPWGLFTNRLASWSGFTSCDERSCRYILFEVLVKNGNNYLGEVEAIW
jgi:hypothetical protein